MCTITCSCGHTDSLDNFCRTPLYGELPKNVYQCPSCHKAVEKRLGTATLMASGFVMPGKVELAVVAPRM